MRSSDLVTIGLFVLLLFLRGILAMRVELVVENFVIHTISTVCWCREAILKRNRSLQAPVGSHKRACKISVAFTAAAARSATASYQSRS